MKKLILSCIVVIAAMTTCYFIVVNNANECNRKIYAVLPLTGSFGVAGKTIQAACSVCEHEQPFDLVYVDSESSSSKALTAVNQATINENYPIVIAGATFASTSIVSAYNELDRGFVFATITPNVKTLEGKKHFQRVSYGSKDVVGPIMEDIVKAKVKNVAIIYEDSDHGNILRGELETSIKGHQDIALIDRVTYSPAISNVKDIVAKIRLSIADAVVVFGGPSLAYVNIFRELKETFGFNGTIYADISFGNEFVYSSLGNTANGIRFLCHDSDLSNPVTSNGRKFRQHCLKHKIPTNYISVQVFDVIGIIEYMIKHKIPFTQEGLLQIGTYDGVSGPIKFDGKGGCYYHMVLANFQDGVLNPVE